MPFSVGGSIDFLKIKIWENESKNVISSYVNSNFTLSHGVIKKTKITTVTITIKATAVKIIKERISNNN